MRRIARGAGPRGALRRACRASCAAGEVLAHRTPRLMISSKRFCCSFCRRGRDRGHRGDAGAGRASPSGMAAARPLLRALAGALELETAWVTARADFRWVDDADQSGRTASTATTCAGRCCRRIHRRWPAGARAPWHAAPGMRRRRSDYLLEADGRDVAAGVAPRTARRCRCRRCACDSSASGTRTRCASGSQTLGCARAGCAPARRARRSRCLRRAMTRNPAVA